MGDTAPPLPTRIAIEVDTMPETKTVGMVVEGRPTRAQLRRYDWGPLVTYHRSPGTVVDFDNHGVIFQQPMGQFDPLEVVSLFMSTKDPSIEVVREREMQRWGGGGARLEEMSARGDSVRNAWRIVGADGRPEGELHIGSHDGVAFAIHVAHDEQRGPADAEVILREMLWISTGERLFGGE
jgi:hypothetical protein